MASWHVRQTGDLGRAIADIRIERGLTQEQLAASIGVGRSYLAKIEAGRSASLLNRILRLLRRLGATVTVELNDHDART